MASPLADHPAAEFHPRDRHRQTERLQFNGSELELVCSDERPAKVKAQNGDQSVEQEFDCNTTTKLFVLTALSLNRSRQSQHGGCAKSARGLPQSNAVQCADRSCGDGNSSISGAAASGRPCPVVRERACLLLLLLPAAGSGGAAFFLVRPLAHSLVLAPPSATCCFLATSAAFTF